MKINRILGENGLLGEAITGFSPRISQQTMAAAVGEAIRTGTSLVVEAGTGTGKTFAYLIPVFLAGKKTLLSTGTRNLQDQLFFRDIPRIRTALSSSLSVALLKGRSNYLCHYRHAQLEQGERLLSRDLLKLLPAISAWKTRTRAGDIAELHDVPEDSALWHEVTSTVDNCLGQECPFVRDCFLLKARRTALAADIVVVNHSLFFSSLVLEEEGFGELLPDADVVIFDEAHELPDLLSRFFSTRLSGRQLLEFARDTEMEWRKSCPELTEALTDTALLQGAVRAMRLALGPDTQRALWPACPAPAVQAALTDVTDILQRLIIHLEAVAERSRGLENCCKRSRQLAERLALLINVPPQNTVRWFETHLSGFTLQLTPLSVEKSLAPFLQAEKKSRIFTSATLSVKNSFRAFVEPLGLQTAKQLLLESPFDYARQAILYVPRGMPDPRHPGYTEALVSAVQPVLSLTGGQAFLLFTSYRAMEEAWQRLRKETDWPLFLQGSLPKSALLQAFSETKGAVLLGTSSFWQGVDIRGNTLSCVVIDRLPFASPDDPVLSARLQKLRSEGRDPFQTWQLPQAVLALKQGAGRLIRDTQDRGILMICDPRLVGSRYGEVFLHSLPPMSRTRSLEKVQAFFQLKSVVVQ